MGDGRSAAGHRNRALEVAVHQLPLQRDGLVETATDKNDRRRKVLRVTPLGEERLTTAPRAWTDAQNSFENVFGQSKSRELRGLLKAVVTTELRGA